MNLKNISSHVLALAFLFLAPNGMATASGLAADPGARDLGRVAKITSGDCDDEAGQHVGTGLVIQQGAERYIITSSLNVSLSAGACHQVSTLKIGSRNAALVAYDWGMGLALLKLSSGDSQKETYSLSDFVKVSDPTVEVMVMGQPLLANAPVFSRAGSMVSAQSHRHRFLLTDNAIEYVGFAADRGMIGAPLIDENKKVVGLISDQYLHLKAGYVTPIMRWKNTATGHESHLLVIPALAVTTWLNKYFSAPAKFRAVFTVDPADLESGRRRVTVGSLSFEEKCPAMSGSGGDEGEIGGNGVGAGGNGVGAGGSDTAPEKPGSTSARSGAGGELPSGHWCVVSAQLASVAARGAGSISAWPFQATEKWALSLVKQLKANRIIDVDYMVTRKKTSRLLLAKKFHSLEDFLMQLKNPNALPVESISGDYRAYTTVGALLTVRQDVEYVNSLFRKVCAFQCWGPLEDMAQNIEVLTKVLMAANWTAVKPEDVEYFTDQKGDFQTAWGLLNWERVEGNQRWKVYGEYGPAILKALQKLKTDLVAAQALGLGENP